MELIPILSTIILVATISTFILAIGAYVLYKVREAKGQTVAAPPPKEVQAELITPAAAPEQREIPMPAPAPAASRTTIVERQPIFVEQRQPMASRYNPQPQQYSGQQRQVNEPVYAQQRAATGANYTPLTEEEKKLSDTRFLKYTSEGYVSPKDDKNSSGALKWR